MIRCGLVSAHTVLTNRYRVIRLVKAETTTRDGRFGAGATSSGDAERPDSVLRAVAAAPLPKLHERALRPGETIGNRYRIERRLGVGGMGVVYAAHDLQLLRAVAIKLVRSRVDSDAAQGRLAREARAMAALRHPNVAMLYDTGIIDDRLFVVMELVDGGTLAEWLSAARRSWRQIVPMFLQAARGLAAAHAAGLVHRDFKPDNVLVGSDGAVRLSDFGVVRFVGELDSPPSEGAQAQPLVSLTATIVGTPAYMAPEHLRGGRADARADQYSFCVALFAALYGERPTPDTLRRPRTASAPRWLHHIVARGLAADPEARWPTVEALTTAIEVRLGRARDCSRVGRHISMTAHPG